MQVQEIASSSLVYDVVGTLMEEVTPFAVPPPGFPIQKRGTRIQTWEGEASDALKKLADNFYKVDPTKGLDKMVELIGGKKKSTTQSYAK